MRTALVHALVLAPTLGLGLAAGCSEPVDVEPLGDYTAWDQFVFRGPAPGHGDTYRIVYANEVATQDGPLFGGYLDGAILVKEIYDDDGGQPGDLGYIAIMRRIGPRPPALTGEGGWVFSSADAPGGEEVHDDYCWSRCHVAAPYNGAFYNYRVPPPP